MKRICRELQERLALEGASALREDAAAQRHLEECDACFSALEGLTRLDEALAQVSAADAPDAVVTQLLERVAVEPAVEAETPSAPPKRRWVSTRRSALWMLASAASVVIVLSLMDRGAFRERPDIAGLAPSPDGWAWERPDEEGDRVRLSDAEQGKRELSKEQEERMRAQGYIAPGYIETATVDTAKPASPPGANEPVLRATLGDKRDAGEKAKLYEAEKEARLQTGTRSVDAVGHDRAEPEGVVGGVAGGVVGGTTGRETVNRTDGDTSADRAYAYDVVVAARFVTTDGRRGPGTIAAPKLLRRVEPVYPEAAAAARVQGDVVLELEVGTTGTVDKVRVVKGGHPLFSPAAIAAVKQWQYEPAVFDGVPARMMVTVTLHFGPPSTPTPKPASSLDPSASPARAFLKERAALDGLTFQDPAGYWQNTYLPGDARLRALQARLAAWDATALALPPHDVAAPPAQPFDAPRNAALAVYVHADRRSLEGPERLLVQVGLQGAARAGGARPAMNVGIVLDLRGELAADAAAAMRALAVAFSEARQTGDRFHLIVAGRPGGIVVGPDAFKHGPVTVALDRLLSGDAASAGFDLPAAVTAALHSVCSGDEAEAPFGTSSVVIVTGQPLGDAKDALLDFAHQGAVAGIAVSAVGVGPAAVPSELEALAFAGQGRRRVLDARASAARLVDEELYAASNAVARAVRLRIRLAPGVRLVEVIGSQHLDAQQAERVREAERHLDLELARHLGIEADRDDDEDGIQIVIPAFQAGDAHAILLDVVAPGPGAVADVSVRYKDVAFLRNGVARASLSLSAGQSAAGPLERNVLKNLLALRLSNALEKAGQAAGAGDASGAAAHVQNVRSLLAALRAEIPGLAADADLARDVAMLETYARLLAHPALSAHRALVADSLRYAGRLKLIRRPV
jgi:TonB family protein